MGESLIVHVIDDDEPVRDSIAMLLRAEQLTPKTHESASAFLDELDVPHSGCVVSDVRMPDMGGLELLETMADRRIELPVIIITAHADVPLAVEAMRSGAVDLIEKPLDHGALLRAVHRALTTQNERQARIAEARDAECRIGKLTAREHEVLSHLVDGETNKMIARKFDVSVRTVEVHRANLMAKMKARNLAELTRMTMLAQRI